MSRRSIANAIATAIGSAVLIVGVGSPAIAAPASSARSAAVQKIRFLPPEHFKAGRYIVALSDASAATYTGGVSGYAATHPGTGRQLKAGSADVTKYTKYLGDKQKTAAKAVGASIDYSYTLALNGFAAQLSAKQATELSKRSGVAAVVPDTILHPQATPDYDFLGLEHDANGIDDGVWSQIGGPANAGKGVVVGDLDTGISPENPSFAGEPLGTTASTSTPYLDGSTITFDKADGNTFTGVCQTDGADEDGSWTADDCSTKIIGARYYNAGFGAGQPIGPQPIEYLSPRDGAGHGSHTASTAAGDYGVDATVGGTDFGAISGMAPAAKIAMYKVCWSGPDASVETDDGCATSDMVAAINQAVADGVDVLNFSIGGGAAQTTYSPTDQAFLGAAAAGIFVSTSAGNSGPGATTLDNASPWYTTVAASTIPSYEGTVALGDGTSYPGATITVPGAGVSGPLVRADQLAAPGVAADEALLCGPGDLDAAAAAGKVVFCARGVYDRVAKSAEVARAGGIGMVLANPTANSLDLDEHSVPTIAVDAPYYQAIYDYAGTAGATATLTGSNTSGIETPTPQVAGFSSRGPVEAAGSDVLKPEISAPGVSIIADGPSVPGADGYTPTFEFMSGTSMASPHIAGLAALYLGVHPTASPAEIKSAMMTTAYDTVDAAGAPMSDPFTQGAGEVDPTKYFHPGLLYLNGYADWMNYLKGAGYPVVGTAVDPTELNLPSISIGSFTKPETVTRTVTSTQAGRYTPTVSVPGFDAVVSPSTLNFTASGTSASYTVTFTRTSAPLDQFATGALDWVGSGAAEGITVHSPIAARPVSAVAPASVSGTGISGSVAIPITNGAAGVPAVTTVGLAKPEIQADDGTATDSTHSGGGSSSDATTNDHLYLVQLPEGTAIAKFAEDAIPASALDYDLYVYQVTLDSTGAISGVLNQWQSATSSADEEVELNDPAAGYYVLEVSLYSGSGDFDVTATLLSQGAGAGGFAAKATGAATAAGSANTVTASWSGLEPDTSYLGLVQFGDGGPETIVNVASGPAPSIPIANTKKPKITGKGQVGASLTASSGSWSVSGVGLAYQWSANGKPIASATASSYRVAAADAGAKITVTVTASKTGYVSASASSAPIVIEKPKPGHGGGSPTPPGHGSPHPGSGHPGTGWPGPIAGPGHGSGPGRGGGPRIC